MSVKPVNQSINVVKGRQQQNQNSITAMNNTLILNPLHI